MWRVGGTRNGSHHLPGGVDGVGHAGRRSPCYAKVNNGAVAPLGGVIRIPTGATVAFAVANNPSRAVDSSGNATETCF